MSSARYAPLPNPHTDLSRDEELEAAFEDSDDEGDSPVNHNARNGAYHSLPNEESAQPPSPHRHQEQPTAYDFENVDYDYIRPPPGSPPGPSTRALPNEWGNTNGLIPSFTPVSTTDAARTRGGWFGRAARSVLPSHYVQRLGFAAHLPTQAVGGGSSNDGVFANVTAKPSRPARIREGDETMLVPEETAKDAPPSYATAQADAAPSYWETTIHAPSSSNSPGEMIIDGLQTGTLFSFLWNVLVSISFQFVGFLLTYLLHTTHAAKLGSRAGLGVTLIQYGFAMRSRADDWIDGGNGAGANGTTTQWGSGEGSMGDWWKAPTKPTFETAAEAEQYYKHLNETLGVDVLNQEQTQGTPTLMLGDIASEWLSFFLMTIGWFLLLTSLLSFWRVKRWERSILTNATPAPVAPADSSSTPPTSTFLRAFSFRNTLLRQGLVYPGSSGSRTLFDSGEEDVNEYLAATAESDAGMRGAYILPDVETAGPERTERLARAFADEARLQSDLRAAGLL